MAKLENQTKVNFYTNIFALIANVLVGLYYTPYLLNTLGLIAYGILPLSLIINQYISVVTQTLTHSYTRFYSVAIQQDNYESASQNISTSLIVTIILSLFIIPLGLFLALRPDDIFTIPTNLLNPAKRLFLFTIFSFILSLFSSLLNVTLYAINRLDLLNLLKIIRSFLKLAIVVLLFTYIDIDVSFVGLANLVTELLILVLSIFFFFKFKPSKVKIALKFFDKITLYAILGMSSWVLIHVCGDTLLYRTDILILNAFWDTSASGALGAISEIGSYITVIISVIGSLYGPMILIQYSRNNHDEVKSLLINQSTIVGSLSAILCGLIAGFSIPVLSIWLGDEMAQYHSWLIIKMVALPYYAAGGIMAFVYRAWNRVKLPALGTIFLGFINIILIILIVRILNYSDPIVILLITMIFTFIQCYILNAFVIARIYPDIKKKFVIIFIRISLVFLCGFLCARLFLMLIPVVNLFHLAISLILTGIVMFIFVFFVVFNRKERLNLLQIIK